MLLIVNDIPDTRTHILLNSMIKAQTVSPDHQNHVTHLQAQQTDLRSAFTICTNYSLIHLIKTVL